MCRNIFALQQTLTNITMTRELALDHARHYFELFFLSPEEILNGIVEKGPEFSELEYMNALQLLNRSQAHRDLGSVAVHLERLEMSFRPLSDDYVAVATIPADVAPISIPSPAIQRLLAKREQDHNSTLDFVSTTCKRVNIQIDHELEREAEKLQEGLTTIKKKIENGSRVVLKSEDDELGALSVDVFQTVWRIVQNCNNSRLELIDGFYDVVKRLERQRSKSFKVVLNEGYKKMGQISFLLPYDLLDYFEHEITKINEITMNNYYYYSRVHTDLKTQAQDEVRFLALDLMDAKDRYRVAAKKLKVREVMDSQLHKRCDFIGCPKEHLQEVDMGDNSFGSMPIHSADVELWSRQIKVCTRWRWCTSSTGSSTT
ncbi:hypothetical protein GEV33_001198 [Tenebrio molitor]|uniref:Exocyst complex component Sec8 n=1 Tax=Tenebrio molitor TaxID=7067 RepID=A0A8J6HWW2_TENMO|nr:hypothetical protein GEV33_001198 [Tenebrio molitor]